MAVENVNGVHACERYKVKGNTTAEKYANAKGLNNSPYCESDKIEDIQVRGDVKVMPDIEMLACKKKKK